MLNSKGLIKKSPLTKEQAYQKIKHFCAYQERCHKEVKDKLYSFGLWKRDVEELIAELISDDYLNEERFAQQYAGGKFRMKHWGKVRIRYELKQKQISTYCIDKALKAIPEVDYEKTLTRLFLDKWRLLGEEDLFVRKKKTRDYLIQKGYELNMITEIMQTETK